MVLTFSLGALSAAYADSATWNLNPISGDWNTAANWMPPTIPNGPYDVATFGLSNQTSVSISDVTEVSGIVFDADASAFTITLIPTSELTLGDAGVVNDSAVIQNFANMTDDAGNASVLRFTGNATAGDSITYTNEGARLTNPPGALIQFEDNSTAGTAQFINLSQTSQFGNPGLIKFTENSTAGDGTFTNTADAQHAGYARIEFHDNASAGNGTFTNEPNGIHASGGLVYFFDSATADHATFTNKAAFASAVWFWNNSTAGNATIINETDNLGFWGYTYFLATSTAGDGLFIANGALVATIFGNAIVDFFDTAKAGNGTFIANGGPVPAANGGLIRMNSSSTAENGAFYANGGAVSGAFGGRVRFYNDTTASAATLIGKSGVGTGEGEGGGIEFKDNSAGDIARVKLFGNGFLDLRGHDTPELTIGSLEGDGLVFLGGANLSVGSNNLSTRFSGLIEENSEGTTGALTKIGTGTLKLTGSNTYAGGTFLKEGGLAIYNSEGSATGTGLVQVDAGTLAGNGIISGAVTVGTGGGAGAFLTPGMGASKATTLTIQSALTFKADGTYTCRLNTRKRKADQVTANGVTIENGAQVAFKVTGNEQLRTGKTAVVIRNTSATPISGTFANLPDGSTFTVGPNMFHVSCEGDDGDDLMLTAIK